MKITAKDPMLAMFELLLHVEFVLTFLNVWLF